MKKLFALITIFALLTLCFCGTAAFAADAADDVLFVRVCER